MSGSLWSTVVTTLTILHTVTGLNVTSPLPAPWSNPVACGSTSAPTSGIHNQTICDPDHVLSPHYRAMLSSMLARCRVEAVMDIPLIVFLAADVTFPALVPGTVRSKPPRPPEDRLVTTIVNSYNLTSQPPVILVLAIRDNFKIALWLSPSLYSVVTREERQEAQDKAKSVHDLHEHFFSSVSHAVHFLCQAVHKDAEKFTTKYILLTVTWIVFVTIFVVGIVFAVFYFVRVRRSRFENPQRTDNTRGAPTRSTSITFSGDLNDVSAVSYRSTGHVLLGTTDITAVSAQNCASTDNLLET